MKTQYTWLIFLLLASPNILLAQSNPTYDGVTLQQTNGWTYSDVSVRLADDESAVVVQRTDGATLNVPVGKVDSIIDAQGKYITSQVIASAPQQKYDEFQVSSGPNSAKNQEDFQLPLPPRLFNVMFGGGLGYGQPFGGFYSDLAAELLYYGDVRITISPLVYVKLAFRNQRMFDEAIPLFDPYDGSFLGNADATVDARQYLVTFGFLNRPHSKNNLRTYAELGAGLVDHVAKATVSSHSEIVHEKRVMFAGEAGVLVPLSTALSLDFGISLLAKPLETGDNEGNGLIFSCHVGLTLSLVGGD